MAENFVYMSLGIAGLIAVACIADIISGLPFGGLMVVDIIFLLSSGLITYMGVNTLRGAGKK